MTELATAALQRFVDALNQPRDQALLGAAVVDDVRVVRHRPGDVGATPIVETFAGIAELAQWFARTPPVVQFSLAGAAAADAAGGWRVEYAIDAGEFHNGGIWIAALAGDGRIAQLAHHPFALPEQEEAAREHEGQEREGHEHEEHEHGHAHAEPSKP